MPAAVTGAANAPREAPPFAPLSLQSLSVMSLEALEDHFRRGRVPPSLEAIEGAGRGRIFRLTGWAGREPAASLVRHLTGSPLFPWVGKRFEASAPDQGQGWNRVGLHGRREVVPFQMRVETSAHDARPCICLDYNLPRNPRIVRGIRDEMREVSPGLFMGPAYLNVRGTFRMLGYFGVSVR